MNKSRKNIRAFTFAELMISLVLISILSAILYPTIAQFTPNSNKPLFKSAYKTLSSVLYEITNDQSKGKIPTDKEEAAYTIDGVTTTINYNPLCVLFCEKANVITERKHNSDEISICMDDCADNILTTSNGMRWRFYPYRSEGDAGCNYKELAPKNGSCGESASDHYNVFKIVVDVNSSNNNLSQLQGVPADTTFVDSCTAAKNG